MGEGFGGDFAFLLDRIHIYTEAEFLPSEGDSARVGKW